jgi:hypothetical protein
MLKPQLNDETGLFVADDPLNEAREILRLLDGGNLEQLSALLAKAEQQARLEAASEILELDTVEVE